MPMDLTPNTSNPDISFVKVESGKDMIYELSVESLERILNSAKDVQRELSSTTIYDRMDVFEEMGAIWTENLNSGLYAGLVSDLSRTTGYSEKLMALELSFVRKMFSKDSIERNLAFSFPNDITGLHSFVEADNGEYYRNMPAGPIFIISSGNSLIPPLIPTTLSLVTGNLTILKPSMSNFLGVSEAFKTLEMVEGKVAKALRDALYISYFTHDSSSLRYLLERSSVGVVNFWGADPARTKVGTMVASNSHHPKYYINGPLTGVAIMDSETAGEGPARDLALNILLYDQQLCSSPTQALFVGQIDDALAFAENVGRHLDVIGGEMPMALGDGQMMCLQNARRAIMFRGSRVFSSKSKDNPWTIVVSRDTPSLDGIIMSQPEFNIYNRRRFLEIVVTDDIDSAPGFIEDVPERAAFRGVDKVQTIGLSLSRGNTMALLDKLPQTGAFRITPLQDMFMRSPLEPYDGMNIASMFTYTVYYRNRGIQPDVMI